MSTRTYVGFYVNGKNVGGVDILGKPTAMQARERTAESAIDYFKRYCLLPKLMSYNIKYNWNQRHVCAKT